MKYLKLIKTFNRQKIRKIFTITCSGFHTEPGKGHFFSNIYQKRNRTKKNMKGNQNNNFTFKRLLIFPFQYIAEKKLKQDYWKGNQNKKYLVLST